MANLIPGTKISLKCLGTHEGPRFLDGRTANATIGLAPITSFPLTGTHWEVIDDGPNRVALKCLGQVEGPRFLDGRTGNGTIGLAPATDGIFTGTHWEVIDDGPNRVALKCLGQVEGPRFLDGRTANGTVGLAPATDGIFTGTHWEVGNPNPAVTLRAVKDQGRFIEVNGIRFTPNQSVKLGFDITSGGGPTTHQTGEDVVGSDKFGSFIHRIRVNLGGDVSGTQVLATDVASGATASAEI